MILQLAGNKADSIVEMANHELFQGNIHGVDLNCGCPQGFAEDKGIGCYLLNNPDNLLDVVRSMVENIKYPVSVKMRLHEDITTTIGIVEKLQDLGVKAVTIHGRYYWQKGNNRGICDWEAIRMIRDAVPNIPLIGNGDVRKYEDFEHFKTLSGVDSVMVGYGALRDPTVFSKVPIPLQDVVNDYLEIAITRKNKLVTIQRHLEWILRQYSNPQFKIQLFQTKDIQGIGQLLESLETPLYLNSERLSGLNDCIIYPLRPEQRNAKQIKYHLHRERKLELKIERKLKHKEI